jgi:mRNA interferase MazF
MTPQRGEVWLVNLDPTVGDEIRKMRPAVTVSRDALGVLALRVVVPITGWQARFTDCDWLVRLDPGPENGLDKVSAADTFQVRSVSARRFARRLGRLSDDEMDRVMAGLRAVLET